MSEILKVTKSELDSNNFYIGLTDVENFEGSISIENNLGVVKFKALSAKFSIIAKAGAGIEAGAGIKAGEGIKAGLGIKAGEGIKARFGIEAGSGIEAGWDIEAGLGIEAGSGIEAGWDIEAGLGIKAGLGIEAGAGIEAGWGIKAGGGIKAGEGIEAGLGIFSKTISSGLRIFAGLCLWRLPKHEETEIHAKLLSGTVAFGVLREPNEPALIEKKPLTDE